MKRAKQNPWLCPKCGKDMEPKPGAVLLCYEQVCVFWRIGFAGESPAAEIPDRER